MVAEGKIRGVRSEISDHPMQVLIRCNRPSALASQGFRTGRVVEARDSCRRRRPAGQDAGRGQVSIGMLNHIALNGVEIESSRRLTTT